MRNFICTGSAGEDRGLAVQRAGGQGNADHIFCKQRVDRTPGGHQASMSAGACGQVHRDVAERGCSMLGPGISAAAHYLSPEPQLASQVVMPDLLRKLDAEVPRGTVLRDTLLHDLINDV